MQREKDEEKLLNYYRRLNRENKDYILSQSVYLYREQNIDKPKVHNYNYHKEGNIIYPDVFHV